MPRLPSSRRGVVWFRWKILTTLSAALCILALFSFNRHSNSTATTTLSSSLSVARSRIPLVKYSGDRPKLAFLFLARRDLPLDFLWDRFFKVLKKKKSSLIIHWIWILLFLCFWQNADQRNFSIYVHSIPGFVFDESSTRSQFFYNRQLKNSIQVIMSMEKN